MTFKLELTKTPTALGDIGYQFFDPDPTGGEQRAADFSIQVKDQDGQIMRVRTGEMIQHMLPAEIQTMQDLLDVWRARSIAEMIP